MSRVADLEIQPAFHGQALTIETYTYEPTEDSPTLGETVFISYAATGVRAHAHLTAGEARRLSLNLAAAADAAERHAAARHQLTLEGVPA